jgi:Tfp pilus assembly protein PilX
MGDSWRIISTQQQKGANVMDESVLKQLAQDALRNALEAVSNQLRELSKDPWLASLNGRDALIAAANAIVANNSRTWGNKE